MNPRLSLLLLVGVIFTKCFVTLLLQHRRALPRSLEGTLAADLELEGVDLYSTWDAPCSGGFFLLNFVGRLPRV